MTTYAWYDWLFFFYLYSFFGWIFESSYVSARERRPVNRGFLRLPMLPIYGSGAVIMLFAGLPMKGSYALEYLAGAAAATALEFVTGWAMEQLFQVRYWDYSDQRFNYKGYICLSSTIAWGGFTVLLIEVIHMPVARDILQMDRSVKAAVLSVVSLLFVYDSVQSVREAYSLGQLLLKLTDLRAELDDLQVQLNLMKAETEKHLAERRQQAAREAFEQMQARRTDNQKARKEYLAEAEALSRELENQKSAALARIDARKNALLQDMDDRKREALQEMDAKVIELQKARAYMDRLRRQQEENLFTAQQELEDKVKEAADRHLQALSRIGARRRSLLLGNPGARSRRFEKAFAELQQAVRQKLQEKDL